MIEQDRRKDEFLATLAHELRNPLAPIRTGLELLRLMGSKSDESVMVRDVHQMMQRQVEHLVRLIDDLLDVSRINTGKIDIQCQLTPVANIISEAVESSRPYVDAGKHELMVTIPDTVIVANLDRARISQVITNLVNNAAKFTPDGGRIWLETKLDGPNVEIRVRDNGIGISADLLPHVFDLFVQAENILTRSRGGLGIGLSLVRRLVELHGGSVSARSPGLGQGSEFILLLPVAKPVQIDPTLASADEIKPGVRRILVVDDNQDAANSLAAILSIEQHICETAFDGPTALKKVADFRPEVLLVDIGMPGMSGLELASKLRATVEANSALIIAVTGWGQPDDRQKCLEAGFDHHLVKPIETSVLFQLLKNLDISDRQQ